ncbi:MAG TPA: CHAT domain-containing tetratricopeptide repeat protein, partial [Vicinamibacterales bacterium]|nr:CHAT domain-containing tetratricopeptide repeat protein [Vicinamibacterales bacterium]
LNQRALAIVERNLGPDSLEAARYLNSVANSYQALGDYPSARALYDRGVRIARARLGERNDWVATFTHNMAMLDASLGDFAQARREHARAVAIWEAVYGRSHPFVALALASMAGVLREQGHAVEAVPMLERALAIRTSRLGPSHREVARTLASLALTEDRLGRTTRALALSQQALAIFEGIGGPPTPDRAVLLSLRGELLTRRGEFAAARAAYAAARDIRVELYGPSHPLVAEAEAGIATADAGLGDAGAAFAAAATAERVGRNHLQLILRSLPERESLNYAASRSRGLDVMLSLPFDRPGAHTDIADAVIRSRALVLDEMAARGRIWLEESRPEVAALWVALSSSRQRLANLVVKGPSDGRPEQYTALVEDARRERELAERTLAVRSAAFREEIAREEIGLDDVRQALPPRSALVAFARYDRTPVFRAATPTSGATSASAVKARPTSAIPSCIAFIVREGQSEITFVRLGSASSIDTLVSRSQAEIMNIVGADSPSEAENTYRVAGAALRRRVWDPVAEYVKGASMVFVVPDGTLNLLSLAALPVGRTGYLIDQGPVIHYLSAERDLVTSSPAAASSRGLLAVGGAAFDDATLFTGKASKQRPVTRAPAGVAVAGGLRASCGDLASLTFDPLAGTLQEVREVARLWSDSPADVLQDRGASEGAFKRAAPGHRVLHLATHGFFLGSTCLPAMGGTRAVGGLAPKRPGQSSAGIADNPLMLSGLALAGANRRAAAGPGDDDGILTAEEVAGLDLRGVEWAVLSACDTGLGEMKAGEGVFGLRRAFQIAGARTVIMSLWSVDDEATRLWMRALYEGRLKKHLSTADAMQQTGLSVLRARRARGETTHPFYWAGFVAAGDWR